MRFGLVGLSTCESLHGAYGVHICLDVSHQRGRKKKKPQTFLFLITEDQSGVERQSDYIAQSEQREGRVKRTQQQTEEKVKRSLGGRIKKWSSYLTLGSLGHVWKAMTYVSVVIQRVWVCVGVRGNNGGILDPALWCVHAESACATSRLDPFPRGNGTPTRRRPCLHE